MFWSDVFLLIPGQMFFADSSGKSTFIIQGTFVCLVVRIFRKVAIVVLRNQ